MKRLLLVIIFATVLVGLLAIPAAAEAPWASTFRLTPKTAYIFAYWDGSWFEVVGEGDAAVPDIHWATDDEGNFVGAPPIPGDYDIVMQLSWKDINYGLVRTLPLTFQPKLSIPEAGVDMTYESAKAYWIGVSLWDEWWVTHNMEIPAFNPHIGAKVYANRWFPTLTGDNGIATNLTADKKLPPGTYTVYYSERLLRPYTSLAAYYDYVDGEWVQFNKTPIHNEPGENVVPAYTFTVAP